MRAIASGLLPRADKQVFQLLREYLHGVEFVGVKQSTWIGFRVTCKLVNKSGDNVLLSPRVVKLARTTVGSLKDIRHLIVQGVVEMMADGIGNCRLAGACIAGQQEDSWTVGQWILRPVVNAVKDGDSCSWSARPAIQRSRPFDISVVDGLLGTRPVVQL